MSDTVLDRIAKLIALASSPHVEEARTAAHMACALIREHGVVLGALNEDGSLRTRETTPPKTKPAAQARPRRQTRTVVIYRCGICGNARAPTASFCEACLDRRSTLGVWTVDCDVCGRSSPSAPTAREVNDVAFMAGYRVMDDGQTLCQRCIARQPASAAR